MASAIASHSCEGSEVAKHLAPFSVALPMVRVRDLRTNLVYHSDFGKLAKSWSTLADLDHKPKLGGLVHVKVRGEVCTAVLNTLNLLEHL